MNTNDLKFLIILAYYKRPIMVKNALDSIKNLSYDNWELVFLDDSGDTSYESELFNFGLDNSKVTYMPINQTDDDKLLQGGSRHGEYMNSIIENSNSDVVIILCDDDALHSDYLTKLNTFYNENPSINWSYCKVFFYNPELEFYSESGDKTSSQYNNIGSTYTLNMWNTPIDPRSRVDSSQVTYRKNYFMNIGAKYPSPATAGLDAAIYTQLLNTGELCSPNGIYGQYKGAFADQLGNRNKNNTFDVKIV